MLVFINAYIPLSCAYFIILELIFTLDQAGKELAQDFNEVLEKHGIDLRVSALVSLLDHV